MSFPRYAAYKDSGVVWLGRLPAHWTIASPVKALTLINGYAFPADKFADEGIPVIRMSEINCGALSLDEAKRIDADLVPSRFLLNKEDVLLGLSGSIDALAIVKEEDLPCALNQRVAAFRGREKFCTSKWAFWFFQSAAYKDQLLAILPQTTIVNVGLDDLKNVRLAAPPIDEQIAIDAFLERETAKIDALVAEQEQLITLLKEKRQAVISHTVTKGLDPSVPMKDSSVEWLGEVPAHWDSGTLTRVASRIVVGIAEAATHAYADSGVPILRSTNIRAGRIIGEILHVDPSFAEERGSKEISAGDLITVRTGNAGVTAVIPEELDGCQCFTMLITSLLDGNCAAFYCYWMNGVAAQHYFALEGWGTAQVNISVPILKALPVPIPPTSEQAAIVSFLDREIKRLDDLTSEAESVIGTLQERRSALISAAVTGQIDVRGLAADKEAA